MLRPTGVFMAYKLVLAVMANVAATVEPYGLLHWFGSVFLYALPDVTELCAGHLSCAAYDYPCLGPAPGHEAAEGVDVCKLASVPFRGVSCSDAVGAQKCYWEVMQSG